MMKHFVFLLGLILFVQAAGTPVFAAPAEEGAPHKGLSFTELRSVPVQSGGRIKPLDSFARESVLFQTGSRSFKGWEPVDLLLSWISYPQYWEGQAFIQVGRVDVRRQLGLDEKRTLFSPQELFRNFALLQYAEKMNRPSGSEQVSMGSKKQQPREQELQALMDRLGLYRNIVSGEAFTLVPKAGATSWGSLAGNDKDGDLIRMKFADLVKGYTASDSAQFATASVALRQAVEGSVPSWDSHLANVIRAEVLYNGLHPFQWSWILFLISALLWLAGGKATWKNWILIPTLAAFGMLVYGIALRCYIAGRPPVTNMYESIIWVAFGIPLFAGILYTIQRQSVMMVVACVSSALALIAADSAPTMMDPGLHPLVPVLRSNYWLTIHVLTITLGYAALALTLGLADVALFQFLRPAKGSTARIFNLNQMTYRAMQFGVVLLAAGTILGGVWADYSWGRFWGWDPKEVWALVALLCYVIILHARFTNWLGQFGYAAWTVVAFLSVMMAWYGVNFVLGAGLHSYGFASGGLSFVTTFVGLQMVYVGLVTLVRMRHQKQAAKNGPSVSSSSAAPA